MSIIQPLIWIILAVTFFLIGYLGNTAIKPLNNYLKELKKLRGWSEMSFGAIDFYDLLETMLKSIKLISRFGFIACIVSSLTAFLSIFI